MLAPEFSLDAIPCQGKPVYAKHTAGMVLIGLTFRDANIPETREKGLEHGPDFAPGKVHAEADVRPGGKGNVPCVSIDVDRVRVVIRQRVSSRCGRRRLHQVTCLYPDTVKYMIVSCAPCRGGNAEGTQELLDRAG